MKTLAILTATLFAPLLLGQGTPPAQPPAADQKEIFKLREYLQTNVDLAKNRLARAAAASRETRTDEGEKSPSQPARKSIPRAKPQ